ncbi:hypothetical protein BG006_010168 [Podila minutissima]|uniref:Uncharacterized protein n=1 Tax=Podila minutissima TaxID=64525 RepID=A0A9P5SQI2_9FUNG|nr:hypothetical protein BG006_010168 [Podila minutissima]
MLVNTVQSHFKFDRFDQFPVGSFDSLAPLKPGHTMHKSPKSYHRRTVSCLAVASHHEHYEHPSYLAPTGRFYETVEFSEATSASPVNHTRHVQRKSEGNISLIQLQQGLSGAGVTNVISSDAKDKSENAPIAGSSLLGGKLIKMSVASPAPAPRRSLLSDLLNSQAAPTRLEQNANRRRMLKSMRRYSVDASEMDFNLCSRPSGRATPMQTISSEGEALSEPSTSSSSPGAMFINGNSFSSTPTVRYLRNPCHAAIKTKLQPSAYRSTMMRRGNDTDGDAPDYFGTEDRVW